MNITFLRNSNVFPKASRWFIRLSVVYLLIWGYGWYCLFSPYFPGEPFPLREYTKVMLIFILFHMPVLLATFSKAKKFRWILVVPLLGMIVLYTLMLSNTTTFHYMLGIFVHLLALYMLFKKQLIEGSKP